jgi:hypothetical protein
MKKQICLTLLFNIFKIVCQLQKPNWNTRIPLN